MGTIFNHYKTNNRGFVEDRGNQLNTPFQIAADGSYSAVVEARSHGLPTSVVQLEQQSPSSPGGWMLVASFGDYVRPMPLSLKAGTYRLSVTNADVYTASITG